MSANWQRVFFAAVAWLLVSGFVLHVAAAARADDAPVEKVTSPQLEMSTSLTFDAQGTPPSKAQPVEVVPPEQEKTNSILLPLLCLLLGLAAGGWLTWRRPQDITPAQDRLAGELSRTRARYLTLLEQRGQRRDPEWDSTVTTLRGDLAKARKQLDAYRDRAVQLVGELDAKQSQDQERTRDRDALAATLSELRVELASAQETLAAKKQEVRDIDGALNSAKLETDALREQLESANQRNAKMDELRAHASRLEHRLDAANADLEQNRRKTGPLTEEARAAQQSVARMLDKNLALEAELARLGERQAISEHGQAQRVAELIEQLQRAEKLREQVKTELDHKLAASSGEHLQRERELSEKLQAAAKQIEASEQAKRRVLSLLRQEKADASDALSELESLRVDHAHTLEQFETVQSMLGTAEDRVDAQDTRLHELIEENNALSREVSEKEDALRAMAGYAGSREDNSDDDESLSTSGIVVTEAPDPQVIAQTIEQLTRSRDAALEEVMHLRAAMETAPTAEAQVETEGAESLNEARQTIRRLKADLRLRSDLIDALRDDASNATAAQTALLEKDEQLALLTNELNLALDETGRLRAIAESTPRAKPADVDRLRERIDGLQERLDAKDRELDILRTAVSEHDDDDMLQAHVSRLEADQDASVTVIRFLEGEVKKLSKELRVTAASRVG
ncbi:MAG: hypothetical protein AB8G17_02415 [Gammaproteobacteria bacterium]